jgi:hypothetical protein
LNNPSPVSIDRQHRVGLVLDRKFGNRVQALSERMHVWMVDSEANRRSAEIIWAATKNADSRDPLEHGVTLFDSPEGQTPEEMILNIIDTILEHHSEWEHDPPISELEIHGAPDNETFRAALESVPLLILGRESGGLLCKIELQE